MEKLVIRTESAPEAIGPYSQAVQVGPTLYLSGQIALDPETNKLVEGGVVEQILRILENVKAVVAAAGGELDHVVKTTLFLRDMSDFQKVNEIYGEYFRDAPPARTTVEVSRLPQDVLVEMDAIAVLEV